MNLWHDIPLGENAPEEFNVVVEIPRGSHNKYEIDKESGLIKLDRVNYSAATYPCDYGFAPQTLWDDGDALDVIVLTTNPIPPGILVSVRPVGLMKMTDDGESDDKVIAVPMEDIRFDDMKDIGDINKHTLKELQHFFEQNKRLKKKPVETTIHGFSGRADALNAVTRSIETYKQKFGK
ncbi:inorganic pyrophosphatase [Candidatus Kaiserbacteria bacterium RIFCSPLOWO2_01_FULL_54_20]|uniref:Inorganic pyrophosphatase n=1 Tax=Candidatus Kaiserbacteria bacterium RIFCSPLOWO2_01_FULL_54_20 TaxID=1798513 RepID=A0A1F6EJK5_9BACT|nr:MAG: inorganic pyrophosphatase [Candidatus Kaiserbacteria bacterium RIFCSPLOWO2_01_FULL_54_20]